MEGISLLFSPCWDFVLPRYCGPARGYGPFLHGRASVRTFRLLSHCVIVGGLTAIGAKMVIAAQRSLVSCTAVSYVVKHFCFISF